MFDIGERVLCILLVLRVLYVLCVLRPNCMQKKLLLKNSVIAASVPV